MLLMFPADILGFNPRIHEGCDGSILDVVHCVFLVSIHASTKDATVLSLHPLQSWLFQSTHPRRMRLIKQGKLCFLVFVSIHASTKDATSLFPFSHWLWCLFQSTHPRRMRPMIRCGLLQVLKVSIHASTKDATKYLSNSSFIIKCFNPRIHEGCDYLSPNLLKAWSIGFNPRIHEGCDKMLFSLSVQLRCFNPRIHEGCDGFNIYNKSFYLMFQSTHPRRMRLCIVSPNFKEDWVSIHASTKDATSIS